VTAGDEIAGSALNPLGRDAKTLLDEAEAKVFAIAEGGFRHQTGFVHINPAADAGGRADPGTARSRQSRPTLPVCPPVTTISTARPPGCRAATC
jgi:hypothetical protein